MSDPASPGILERVFKLKQNGASVRVEVLGGATTVARIDFLDLTELVPAFATIGMMVFTYNIGNGLTDAA